MLRHNRHSNYKAKNTAGQISLVITIFNILGHVWNTLGQWDTGTNFLQMKVGVAGSALCKEL
jgi:hypothetical protein